MRKSTLVLGTITALCALTTALTWQQLVTQRERADALQLRLAQLDAGRSPAVNIATRAHAPAVVELPSAQVAREQSIDVLALYEEYKAGETEKERDPAYLEAKLAEARRQFASSNEDARRVLGLTDEQWFRFVDLQARRKFANGVDEHTTNEELHRMIEAQDGDLRALLGEEKLAKWQEYRQSYRVREEVAEWRIHAQLGPESYSDSQFDEVVATIYSERERLQREYASYAEAAGRTEQSGMTQVDRQRYLELNLAANNRIHAEAARSLSETQLSYLDAALHASVKPIEDALRRQ